MKDEPEITLFMLAIALVAVVVLILGLKNTTQNHAENLAHIKAGHVEKMIAGHNYPVWSLPDTCRCEPTK
jgi:hypothetical protein